MVKNKKKVYVLLVLIALGILIPSGVLVNRYVGSVVKTPEEGLVSEVPSPSIKEIITEETTTPVEDFSTYEVALSNLLTIPRGTEALKSWEEGTKNILTPELYSSLGVDDFITATLPLQANYDKDPNYFNTSKGDTPEGYRIVGDISIAPAGGEGGFTGSYMVSRDFGGYSEVKNYSYSVVFDSNDKISELSGTHLNGLSRFKKDSAEDYRSTHPDFLSGVSEGQQVDLVYQHLVSASEAIKGDSYFTGVATQSYADAYWSSDSYGNNFFASQIRGGSSIKQGNVVILSSGSEELVNWSALVVNETGKVTARINGVLDTRNSTFRISSYE